jgi:putative membrane protein
VPDAVFALVGTVAPAPQVALMKALLLRSIVLAAAFLIVDAVMDSLSVSGGFFTALGLAIVYGLVSAIVGTFLRMLALPVVLVTAGVFEVVINAVLLTVTDSLTDSLEIDGFSSALVAALLLALASILIGLVIAVVFPAAVDVDD